MFPMLSELLQLMAKIESSVQCLESTHQKPLTKSWHNLTYHTEVPVHDLFPMPPPFLRQDSNPTLRKQGTPNRQKHTYVKQSILLKTKFKEGKDTHQLSLPIFPVLFWQVVTPLLPNKPNSKENIQTRISLDPKILSCIQTNIYQTTLTMPIRKCSLHCQDKLSIHYSFHHLPHLSKRKEGREV